LGALGCVLVAMSLNKNVDQIPVLIHRPQQGVALTANSDEHFVKLLGIA